MGAARGWLRALGALTAASALAGCTTPIGVRSADPHEVQRYLTRSALTDDRPSDLSLNQLRRYDLLRTFDNDPDAALAKLHAAALAEDFPPTALFALAELSFLRANQTKQQASYAAAMIYSWATLFPERGRPAVRRARPARADRRGPLQPRAHLRLQAHEGGHDRDRRRRRDRTALRPRHRDALAGHARAERKRALRPAAGGRDRGQGAAQPLPTAGDRRSARRQDASAARARRRSCRSPRWC